MGTRKLPDAVKLARGTLKKYRSSPNAPKPEAIVIGAPPTELAPDEAEVWTRLATALNPLHIVGDADLVGVRANGRRGDAGEADIRGLVVVSEPADPRLGGGR